MQINLCVKEFEFENKLKNIGVVVVGFRPRNFTGISRGYYFSRRRHHRVGNSEIVA